ncbi:exonuclease SbcCD subunit D C-terminal domain-containing protein [Desulfobacter vibrioformis]|uniref:exonuclease SbcCD subunit D C-terminal domain-containing protein n=1 Tax=Desulfobacter vibrioformis TaxID=34031 RepID=UPI0005595BEF|nr:exonuclease SbcCD subunit D C-terminal domain-containing protein [Desulfobacter vibrioformis]
MKILHTSDWHLGRCLYGRKRYGEFSAFLDWLARTIEDEKVDALLVAGDVFDTSTPSNRAQELYYRFLCRVGASCCRHVVVIAGNHDSPSFLNAPRELLRALNVYVVGSVTDALDDEVIVLRKNPQISQIDADGVDAIICAVPYLRDRDIRIVEPGETIDDKNRKLVDGIKKHYETVVSLAEQKRYNLCKSAQSADKYIPIIALGHLFTAGGKTVDGDGVRDLYVGSLAHVGGEVFPSSIDYLALGHLHVPQAVGSAEHIRYCGSPIPMGYGEAAQEKKVVLIEFNPQITGMDPDKSTKKEISGNQRNLRITEKTVPCFQQMVRIVGSLDDIHAKLDELKKEKSSAWLEIEYTGSNITGNLREVLDGAIADSTMEIRRIKNRRVMDRVMSTIAENETLDDLDANDVFIRCLETFDVPDEDRQGLTSSYNEIIKSLHEQDVNAE